MNHQEGEEGKMQQKKGEGLSLGFGTRGEEKILCEDGESIEKRRGNRLKGFLRF